MIDRISKLLALAENAATPEEADAAYSRAQALCSKFSIDEAVARAHKAKGEKRSVPETRTVRLTEDGTRANADLVKLYSAVAQSNDVRLLIRTDSRVVYPTGYVEDLDAVEALYSSLAVVMLRGADALVRDKGAEWRRETVTVWDDKTWEMVTKPVTWQAAKKTYLAAFASRIGQRLRAARAEAVAEAEKHFHEQDGTVLGAAEDDRPLPSSMGLVLKDKTQSVMAAQESWYTAKYGNRRTSSWRGGQTRTSWSDSAAGAGRAAADRAGLSGRKAVGA